MADEQNRSEPVIEAYKQHKLAYGALRRIHDLISRFDAERAADRRLAWIGITLVLAVIGLACLYFATAERVTLY